MVGIANDSSIAYACARTLKASGAELAITYINEKAKPFVDPIAQELHPSIYMRCNVTNDQDLTDLFAKISQTWGQIDIIVHSIAFAPTADLHGPLFASSKDGFLLAMDISCHSFIRMTNLAKPLMKNGGALFTMSFYGAEKVVHNYNLMGPVKAALEASVRYMAAELGPENIRVIAISPGPLKTRAASGLEKFDELIQDATHKSPLGFLANINDIGAMVTFLASDYAKSITGDTIYIDSGYHIMA